MSTYIGMKAVSARPMTRAEYNEYRGWELPENEAGMGDDLGYLVEYLNSNDSNHPSHKGYISWSPKDQFELAYKPVTGLSFGIALQYLHNGKKVARRGWNGKDTFIFLVPGSRFEVNRPPLLGFYQPGTKIDYQPHIDMRTASGSVVPWLASQTDVLAEDWEVVD